MPEKYLPVYHGTRERVLPEIMRRGLRAGSHGELFGFPSGTVSTSVSKKGAEHFTYKHGELLKFKIPKSAVHQMAPREYIVRYFNIHPEMKGLGLPEQKWAVKLPSARRMTKFVGKNPRFIEQIALQEGRPIVDIKRQLKSLTKRILGPEKEIAITDISKLRGAPRRQALYQLAKRKTAPMPRALAGALPSALYMLLTNPELAYAPDIPEFPWKESLRPQWGRIPRRPIEGIIERPLLGR